MVYANFADRTKRKGSQQKMVVDYELFNPMTESVLFKKTAILEAIRFIRIVTNFNPRLALILGSGLGDFAKKINTISEIRFSDIPFYPISLVQGHAGKLSFGYLHSDYTHSIPLLVFQGRVHFYEIESIERVAFPIILAHQLGIKHLVVTNAAGGINSRFTVGDSMLIEDILNLASIDISPSLPDLDLLTHKHSNYFDTKMKHIMLQSASQLKIPLRQGVYGWLRGPSYETPAEIQMLKQIGVDAIGMSTVPEILVAHRLGMKTVGLSFISNLAAGISPARLSHSDVMLKGAAMTGRFSELMERFLLSNN